MHVKITIVIVDKVANDGGKYITKNINIRIGSGGIFLKNSFISELFLNTINKRQPTDISQNLVGIKK